MASDWKRTRSEYTQRSHSRFVLAANNSGGNGFRTETINWGADAVLYAVVKFEPRERDWTAHVWIGGTYQRDLKGKHYTTEQGARTAVMRLARAHEKRQREKLGDHLAKRVWVATADGHGRHHEWVALDSPAAGAEVAP